MADTRRMAQEGVAAGCQAGERLERRANPDSGQDDPEAAH